MRNTLLLILAALVLGGLWTVLSQREGGDTALPVAAGGADGAVAEHPARPSTEPASILPTPATPVADDGARQELHRRLAVRVTCAGEPVAGALVRALPWSETIQVQTASFHGLAFEQVRAAAVDLRADDAGIAELDVAMLPMFVAAGGPGIAPTGVLVEESAEGTIELACEVGQVIRGHAVVRGGGPLAGTQVLASRLAWGDWLTRDARCDPARVAPMLLRSEAVTDGQGHFELPGLAKGPTIVRVDDDRYPGDLTLVYCPDPREVRLEVHPTAADVSGRVVADADGIGIAGVLVSSFFKTPTIDDVEVGMVYTDAEGRFALRTRGDAERIGLRASHQDYACNTSVIAGLRAGSATEVEIRMRPGVQLVGTVRAPDGEPVTRVNLRVYRSPGLDWSSENVSRDDGSFFVPQLEQDAEYVVLTGHTDYRGEFLEHVTTAAPLEITLVPLGRLSGRLLADGSRIEDGRVRVVVEDSFGQRKSEEWTEVDPDTGRFVFARLDPGRYRLDAVARDFAPVSRSVVEVASGGGGEELVLSLTPGVRVRGVVTDGETGRAIAGARISLADGNFRGIVLGPLGQPVTSMADGSFTAGPVAAGDESTLLVDADGYARNVLRVVDPAAVLRAELRRTAGLTLSLTDRFGNPVRGLVLDVLDASNATSRYFDLNATELQVNELVAGDITFCLSSPPNYPGQFWTRTATLMPGEMRREVIELGGGARVHGRLRMAETIAYTSGFQVQAQRTPQGDDNRICIVDPDQRFEFDGLLPGPRLLYLIAPVAGGRVVGQRVVELREGDDVEADIEIPAAGFLGDVRGPRGEPIEGATMTYSVLQPGQPWDGQTDFQGVSNPGGSYSIVGLAAGHYRIQLRANGYGSLVARGEITDPDRSVRLDLTMAAEAVLSLRCLDADGSPAAAQVDLVLDESASGDFPLNLPRAVATDAHGEALVERLVAGDWTLTVSAPGRFVERHVCTLAAGQRREEQISLRRVGSLELVVNAAGGQALAGQPVALADERGGDAAAWLAAGFIQTSTGSLLTDARGTIRIDGLPEGRLQVACGGAAGVVSVEPGELTRRVLIAP